MPNETVPTQSLAEEAVCLSVSYFDKLGIPRLT
jgi:hypothetical protein